MYLSLIRYGADQKNPNSYGQYCPPDVPNNRRSRERGHVRNEHFGRGQKIPVP